MFSDTISNHDTHENRIENVQIAPQQNENSESMLSGGSPIKNVLLNHLNDDAKNDEFGQNENDFQFTFNGQFDGLFKDQHNDVNEEAEPHRFGHKDEEPQSLLPPNALQKVNLVMTANQNGDNPSAQVKMTAIPLIVDNDQLQSENIRSCTITAKDDQCEVYIADDFDYDIRIENIGESMAEINLFTVDLPTNGNELPPANNMELMTELPVTTELPLPINEQLQNAAPPPVNDINPACPLVVIGVILSIIIVSLMALLTILKIKKSRRRRLAARQQAFVDDNGEILISETTFSDAVRSTYTKLKGTPSKAKKEKKEEFTTVHMTMDDQLKYDVFAVV